MLMTSGLLYIAMREVWGWSIAVAGAVAAAFLVVDGAFFPSDGAVNPSLTIIANAIRDGDHLIGRLQ